MAKGSDNPFPSVLVVEGATPATPAAGRQRLFVDTTDGHLKRVDDGGTVTDLEAAAGGGGIATEYLHLRKTGGSQAAASGGATWVDVTWGNEKNDSWGGYSGAGANWTVDESGLYSIHFKVAMQTTSVCYLGIFDGTDYALHCSAGGSASDLSPHLAGTAYLDSTKTYTARFNSVVANNVLDGDFGYRTNLIVAKIKG